MIGAVFMLGEIRAFFMLILGGGDTWKAGSIEYYSFDAETGTSAIGYRGVRGKVILQSQGKEFFTWHGKDFFT